MRMRMWKREERRGWEGMALSSLGLGLTELGARRDDGHGWLAGWARPS